MNGETKRKGKVKFDKEKERNFKVGVSEGGE
jgi:hypothetical protein